MPQGTSHVCSLQRRLLCNLCGETKPLKDYSAIVCKQFLQEDEGWCTDSYRCYECQYPRCTLCAGEGIETRPQAPVSHNHVEADGKWYCHAHKYPPCRVCRTTPRSEGAARARVKFEEWVGAVCKE